MASPVFINSSYYQRAWRMLTSQKGWGKTIMLIILALIVPLVGVLGVMGYCLERARMIAWGMQNAPEKEHSELVRAYDLAYEVLLLHFVGSLYPPLF